MYKYLNYVTFNIVKIITVVDIPTTTALLVI